MERLQTTVHIFDASKGAQKDMSAVAEKKVKIFRPGNTLQSRQGYCMGSLGKPSYGPRERLRDTA